LKSLIGKHHGESQEARELGLKIIGHLREKCDEYKAKYKMNFSCYATPAEGLSGKFTRQDKIRFGDIP
jgi:ribonucleoside-triphosphate reductase